MKNSTKPGPKSIQETQLYKDSVGSAQRFWNNYVNLLRTSFKNMPRAGQERLIIRFCQVITIGSSIWFLMFIYSFLPTIVRVFVLPVVVVASWWVGTRIVGSVMIERFSRHLNKEI